MSRTEVENEIRETLGQVPSFFQTMPDSTLENEWNEFKRESDEMGRYAEEHMPRPESKAA